MKLIEAPILVARYLRRFPKLKRFLKRFYIYFMRFVFGRSNTPFRSAYLIESFPGSDHSCFGYFDKSPEDRNGNILYYDINVKRRRKSGTRADVSLKVIDSMRNEIISISTEAFNWQQGARAHWLSNGKLIYNKLKENKVVAEVIDITSGEKWEYGAPVQDSASNFFLSVDYCRLTALGSEYGYSGLKTNPSEFSRIAPHEGVQRIDIETGKIELIAPLCEIAKLGERPVPEDSWQVVNHVLINPEASKAIFLHRYRTRQGQVDRLICIELKSGVFRLVFTSALISHFCWISNTSIVVYQCGPNGDYGYFVMSMDDGSCSAIEALSGFSDGHPTYHAGRLAIDTYPDFRGVQRLVLLRDLHDARFQPETIAEFYHPLKFEGHTRCDLHPRFNFDGSKLFIDSVHTGVRALYRIELPDETEMNALPAPGV